MEKIIKINGQDVKLKASAATPHKYRMAFRRDLLTDMSSLLKAYNDTQNGGSEFSRMNLEVFENVAFIMAKQAGCAAADIDEWLDQFEVFDIYEALPQILDMWGMETETFVVSKKN